MLNFDRLTNYCTPLHGHCDILRHWCTPLQNNVLKQLKYFQKVPLLSIHRNTRTSANKMACFHWPSAPFTCSHSFIQSKEPEWIKLVCRALYYLCISLCQHLRTVLAAWFHWLIMKWATAGQTPWYHYKVGFNIDIHVVGQNHFALFFFFWSTPWNALFWWVNMNSVGYWFAAL